MTISVRATRNIIVDGVQYESVEQMPPEVRNTFEQAAARRQPTAGRMAAWMLFAAAVIGLLLLIYSSPR